MTKKELIKKIEEVKEILEMDIEEYAKKHGIESNSYAYAYRTGHVKTMLDFILKEERNGLGG